MRCQFCGHDSVQQYIKRRRDGTGTEVSDYCRNHLCRRKSYSFEPNPAHLATRPGALEGWCSSVKEALATKVPGWEELYTEAIALTAAHPDLEWRFGPRVKEPKPEPAPVPPEHEPCPCAICQALEARGNDSAGYGHRAPRARKGYATSEDLDRAGVPIPHDDAVDECTIDGGLRTVKIKGGW